MTPEKKAALISSLQVYIAGESDQSKKDIAQEFLDRLQSN